MSVARERLLLRTLVELADTLVTDYEVVDFLYLLCDRAVEILGADVADLREDTARWPAFAEQATDRGFRSVHARPLRVRDEHIGAMDILYRSPGAFSEDDAAVAGALADMTSIGIYHQRTLRTSPGACSTGSSTAPACGLRKLGRPPPLAERQRLGPLPAGGMGDRLDVVVQRLGHHAHRHTIDEAVLQPYLAPGVGDRVHGLFPQRLGHLDGVHAAELQVGFRDELADDRDGIHHHEGSERGTFAEPGLCESSQP